MSSDYSCKSRTTCSSIAQHCTDVSVSVGVRPYAIVGDIKTECCGKPTVHHCSNGQSDDNCCCELVVTQTLSFRIPIEFGASAQVGDEYCTTKVSNQKKCFSKDLD